MDYEHSYEICYNLRKVLEDSVELILETLLLDSSLDLSGIGAKILVNRTSSLNLTNQKGNKRILQNSSVINYFDVIQQIFVKNLYAFDGYFPYPE